MIQADITPTTALIQSWRQQLPHWSTIFGELIDNAFDAGATQVRLVLEANRLVVADNGSGCPDLALMLTAGRHTRHTTTRLGRYGIGFKQAVASAGDTVQIVSIHAGVQRQTQLSWPVLERSGHWTIDLPEPLPTTGTPGTTITISHLRNKIGLRREQIATLVERLSEQYTPAIKQGRQLLLQQAGKVTMLHAAPLPELEYTRNLDLAVGPKKATLLLGLLPAGASYPRSGLTVSYGFRVIERGVRWGLGEEPTPGLLGWLDLLHGWDLSTNKERLLDDDLEALSKQIAERCADVIARAIDRGLSVPLDDASQRLTTMLTLLRTQQQPVKERRRSPTVASGAIAPQHTGRRRLHATLTQPGRAFLRDGHQTHGIKISLAKLGPEAGLYNFQPGGIIELNVDNPIISARRHDREFLAIQAIHAFAAHAVLDADSQRSFPFLMGATSYDDLSKLTGMMMSHLPPMHAEALS